MIVEKGFNLPYISIIVTTYNEEDNLDNALSSVTRQDYPKDKIEIILVDDKSTDKTLEIAKNYTDKIYISGKRFCEISRAVGLKKANYDLVFFIDADNILPTNDFLLQLVEPFQLETDLVGSYPAKFFYNPDDHPANRYCSLFGINDPLQFYTKAREHLSQIEDKWTLAGKAINKQRYYLVQFDKGNMLTLGAIGFLARKDLMLKKINGEYFFHSDVCNELINEGHNKFAVIKQTIVHNHVYKHIEFFKKLDRNLVNFLNHGSVRRNVWVTKSTLKLIKSAFIMSTVIIPLYHALKGYIKIKDWAWFLHPTYCFICVCLYCYRYIPHKIKEFIYNR